MQQVRAGRGETGEADNYRHVRHPFVGDMSEHLSCSLGRQTGESSAVRLQSYH